MLCRYCIFYKLKVCGNSVLSQSMEAIFPTAFAHCMSLYHILVLLTILQTLYGDLWSVIFGVTIVIVLGCCKPRPCKTVSLINKCRVFCLLHRPAVSPSLSPSSGLPIPWDTTIVEIRTINNTMAASKCSSERKSHTSLTLNQTLEMIKRSEEGMLKDKTNRKLVPNC